MADEIRKLGRYELLQRIAKGGMGEIYLARSRGAAGFEKSCIIKTILPHLAEEEEFVDKFLDEGRIVVQLVHGNIVPVFDMGEEQGEYFIAMEYIPGRDLREVVKSLGRRHDTMSVDLALYIVSEVCKGLDYAHRKSDEDGEPLNIIHRDVSPSNVLISREGEVKLIDFGIARATNRLSKTVSGRIQGKFCYMSPEQASGKPLDRRSDIFSAGVVLYELLTGFRPFEGETDLQSLDLVRKCEFDPASTLNSAVPEEIDTLVGKALARDPDDRFASAGDFQIELLQYLYSTGTSPTGSHLSNFLVDLFPDGLERQDLKDARGNSSKPKPKMSLDSALDHELDRLLDAPGIDPHETTAADVELSASLPRLTPVTDEASPGASTAPTAPDRPSDLEDQPEKSLTPVPQAMEQGATEGGATDSDTGSAPQGFKRWIAIAGMIGVVAGIAMGVWLLTRPVEGMVRIDSDPPNALIYVDGARILDKQTPATLYLPAGDHVVEIRKEGHEPERFQVPVERGETFEIGADEARLVATHTLPERRLTATVTPADAQLTVDNVPIETGGTFLIRPEDKVFLRATHDDCDTYQDQIAYEHPDDQIEVVLSCEVAKADAGLKPAVEEKAPATEDPQPRMVSVRLESNPSGARVLVNGRDVGLTPVRQRWRAAAPMEVVFEKSGFEPFSERRKAGSFGRTFTAQLQELEVGCIKARAVYPNLATILIDDRIVSEGDSSYEGKLSVGKHRVTFRNAKIEKEQTFEVDIEAGSECARVSWDLGS